jgi:hypothetical protein
MSNRFEATRAKALVDHLRSMGIEARVGAPDTSLHNGCSDPEHCQQHLGRTIAGKSMLSVVTSLSNTRLHKEAVRAGLLPPD